MCKEERKDEEKVETVHIREAMNEGSKWVGTMAMACSVIAVS